MEELRMEIAEFLAEWFCPVCYDLILDEIKVDGREVRIPSGYIDDACPVWCTLPPQLEEEARRVTDKELYDRYGYHLVQLSERDIIYLKREYACERVFDSKMEEILARYGYDYVGRIWTDGYYIIKKKEQT